MSRFRSTDNRARMAKVYGDDLYAALGFDHAHLGFWAEDSEVDFATAQHDYLRRLVAPIGLRPGDRVLDLGGGQGGTAVWLVEHFDVDVTTVDVADSMVAAALARVRSHGLDDRVCCVRDDVVSFRADRPFDAVVSVEALYHVSDQDSVFASVADSLRPGGTFAISVFTGAPRPRFLAPLYLWLIVGETRLPSRDDYRRAIRSCGLELLTEDDLTEQTLPRSGDLFRQEPLLTRIEEYHREHFGRLVAAGIPLLSRWHDRVLRSGGLRLTVYGGSKPEA